MLSKINRLKNTKDIERVFKNGKGIREGFLFLKLVKNKLGYARIAFVVSRKVSNKASVRNQIKRRMRESVKRLMPQAKAGLDVVAVVQAGAVGKDFSEINNNIIKLFKKANLI